MDCAAVLAQTGRTEEAAALARLLVESGYESLDDLMIAMWLTFHAQGPDAAGQWLGEQVGDSADLEHHRLAQDFQIHVAGQLPAVRQLYQERFQAAPEAPDAAYLHFRVAADTSQLPEWAKRFPDHAPLHRSLAWKYLHEQRWADALAEYDHLADLDPNELWRTQYAAALAGADRPEQALSVLSADPTDGQSLIHARILARRLGADAPSLDELSELDRVRVLAQTGEAVETDDPVATIQAAAWQGPEAMMAAVEQAPPEEELDLETWLLAYAEARRSGREELAEALASSSPFPPADEAAITTWLADGTWDPTLDDLSLRSLAGLELGRARQPGVPPQEATELRDQARDLAVLPSVVSEAALLW